MAMQRIEDMDSLDIESMVSVMLEEDNKASEVQYPMPKLGDADGLWNMLNANKPSSGKSSFTLGRLVVSEEFAQKVRDGLPPEYGCFRNGTPIIVMGESK